MFQFLHVSIANYLNYANNKMMKSVIQSTSSKHRLVNPSENPVSNNHIPQHNCHINAIPRHPLLLPRSLESRESLLTSTTHYNISCFLEELPPSESHTFYVY